MHPSSVLLDISIYDIFHGTRSTKPKENFTAKSTWNPPCQNKHINKILEQLEDFSSITNKHRDNMGNLSESQLVAISTLKRNPSVIIKPADKGSATVTMYKMNYIAEVERHLCNQKHYAKLDTPVYPQPAVRISATLDKLRQTGYISKKQREYLEPPDTPRPRLLYLLPKIHKAKDKWPQPQMPPGRPIIPDCSGESYKIAEYIDHF